MLSIRTDLSSLIAQNSLTQSTNKLNQAIERMTTGAKINHAKDNAANYSINTNMTTKMGAYMIAQDNVAMGLDMVATMSENLDLVSNHVRRIRDLCEQASNGTYGADSLKAIQSEIDARVAEVERLKSSAEFNGIKLFNTEQATPVTYAMQRAVSGVTGKFIEEVDQLTEDEALAQGYTIIKTADDLQNMIYDLNGKYILMNDIDLAGYSWRPIADASFSAGAFKGELNGNGYVIKNLKIDMPVNDKGFIAKASEATIKNLGIENAEVIGGSDVGILIGEDYGSSISNCYVEGSVNGVDTVGGLIGYASCNTIATNCYANVNVVGSSYYVGGICGIATDVDGANLVNCFSTGSVSGTSYIGGLIGAFGNGSNYVVNSYSSCSVSGTTNIGSLFGAKYDTATNCYFDKEKSGISVASGYGGEDGCQGVTTAELQALIDNGTLPKINPLYVPPVTPTGSPSSITLQVGTNGDSNSQITFDLATTLAPLEITITDSDSARAYLTILDNYLSQISDYQTNFGAVTNRLESALDEITIQYENLASSRSTIRDADMAELSSTYIQQQILQQASATLLSTAKNIQYQNVLGLLQSL